MSAPRRRADSAGQLLAILVFLAGVGVLFFVFTTALHLFRSPVPGLELPVRAGSPPPPAASIGTALALFVRQLLLLILMTLAGSLIASKGVQLYFGANHWTEEHAAAPPTAAMNGHASGQEGRPAAEAPLPDPSPPLKTSPPPSHSQGEE